MAKETDYLFDMAKATGKVENKYLSQTEPHPTDEGCSVIAEKFLEYITKEELK